MNETSLLSLPEIAVWQINNEFVRQFVKPDSIIAELPALQRGSVWKVKQTEELWDSVLRRFPVGSFVVSQAKNSLNHQDFKLQQNQEDLPPPTHLLLDGQQRATSIALGFYDIWQDKIQNAPNALWLDLDKPPSNREAEFIFRVTTRAHPWGYKRSNPDEILTSNQIRAARLAFEAVNHTNDENGIDLSLFQTWPWDAEAPVPLAILFYAIHHHPDDLASAKQWAWEQIQKLPMFNGPKYREEDEVGHAVKDAKIWLTKQREKLQEAFTKKGDIFSRTDAIFQNLQKLICGPNAYQIPALPLDLENTSESVLHLSADEQEDAAKKDSIELLFVRINSAGTPLEGEELTYSLLKAAWPKAANFIKSMTHKTALPSRIAILCIRIVLAQQQFKSEKSKKAVNFPPVPGVNEFRRLVRNQNPQHPNFIESLQKFIEQQADELFSDAWQFLTDDKKGERSFVLLPIQAVEIAQKAPDVYFLLLYWLWRLKTAGIDTQQIDQKIHRRTLGFLTAITWFAKDKNKACSAIWTEFQDDLDNEKLRNRFNKALFKKTCGLDKRFNLRMVPLLTPDQLLHSSEKLITGYKGCQNTISKDDSEIWTDWNWYQSFIHKIPKDQEIKNHWASLLNPNNNEADETLDITESTLQAMAHFMDTLWVSRSILLYAQRSSIKRWYPDFDPSLPEFMEDKNRPWDYDHILPQNLLRSESGNSLRNIPAVIWDWFGSIGNLRAWPLEANRSDSDISPSIKLNNYEPPSREERRYGIVSSDEKLAASFIDEEINWPHWQNSVPMTEDNTAVEDRRYLAKEGYRYYQKNMIKAIVFRFVEIYREWYQELQIKDLY